MSKLVTKIIHEIVETDEFKHMIRRMVCEAMVGIIKEVADNQDCTSQIKK